MKVGVPLGNWIYYVFNAVHLLAECQLQTTVPFTNFRRPLRIHISSSEGWLSQCAIGNCSWICIWNMILFLYSGIANRKGIVDIGIASFVKSDLVSCGVPLGWGEICPHWCEISKCGVPLGWCEICPLMWENARARIMKLLILIYIFKLNKSIFWYIF